MNSFLIRTSYFVVKKLIFKLVQPESWKKDLFKTFFFTKNWQKINLLYRSSHQRCSLKKVFLKNFTKFTGKHLYWSLFFNKDSRLSSASLLKKKLQQSCFPVNFVKFSIQEHLFYRNFMMTSSFCNSSHSFILQRSFIYLLKPCFLTKFF